MKFYLSSYHLGNHPEELSKMFEVNKKVAIITNAMDAYSNPAEVKEGIEGNIAEIKGVGLIPEILDLREYFGKNEELSKKLSKFGGVWVRGGNTFILRKAFTQSGFDEWLIEHKNDKDFVYAGYSAGVCLLSPSLKGLEIVDDPNVTGSGYNPGTIWEGLGFVDYLIVPHYKSDHHESYLVDKTVDWCEKNKIKYKTLRDGEVIIMKI